MAREAVFSFLSFLCLCLVIVVMTGARAQAATFMSDGDLEGVTGQALFDTTETQGTGSSSGITFYTIGLDVTMAMNVNIQNLQLGCGGTNTGAGSGTYCDIDAKDFSLSGTPGVTAGCPSGAATTNTAGCDTILTRPSITLAIANDNTAFRQVVGAQLGAQNFAGELGVGSFNTFSGYLSATGNINMTAGTNVAVTCTTGTCQGGAETYCGSGLCGGGAGGAGILTGSPAGFSSSYSGVSQYAGTTGLNGSLGLLDDYACALLCAGFDSITVNTPAETTSNIPIVLQGNRLTQSILPGSSLQLGTLVHNASENITVNQSEGLSSGLLNAIIGLIEGEMEQSIDNQVGAALTPAKTGLSGNVCETGSSGCNGTYTQAELNTDSLPYNINNLHLVDINSNQFGLSFEKQALQWPGYVASVPTGWAMYLPNAFTLNITDPISTFTSNIVSGAAAAGNVVSLAGPPQNCYGSYKFC